MKQGTAITRAVILLLLAAVLAYLGFSLWQGLSDPYQLIVTYSYEMDDDLAIDGVVVREEQTIPGRAALAEVLPREGERVPVGASVALIYQDESALSGRRRAREIEQELEQVRYAMRIGSSQSDAKELDGQLVSDLAHLRANVSAGTLDDLEEQGSDIRSLVVKRTVEPDSGDVTQLQETADQLESELADLNASSQRTTRRVTVDRAGTFSGLADGYEALLTPELLENMTVADLEDVFDREVTAPADSLGKLITDSTWYFATVLSDEDTQRLEEGKRCTMVFSGDFNEEMDMTLERIGPSEDGRRVVVFSTDRALNQVTLCRFVSARLVFERYTGVRIPDQALRVRDNDDGTTTPGVYTLVGRQVEFKPVEVIREGDGFYLVRGTATNRKVLRPGDTLVLSNEELYDGKVVA